MSKSKSGRREGSATRTVYTGGPARQLPPPVYCGKPPLKMAPSRVDINNIRISRTPDIIGAPRREK